MVTKSPFITQAVRYLIIASALWSYNAEAATLKVLKLDQMREGPLISAKVVAELRPGTTVIYIGRRGFWVNIEVAGSKGWVRITTLNIKDDGKGAGLAALASGRGATGNVVNTSGTRGLSAEELNLAQPDFKELEALKKLEVQSEEAVAFAKLGKLLPRSMNYVKHIDSKNASKGDKR